MCETHVTLSKIPSERTVLRDARRCGVENKKKPTDLYCLEEHIHIVFVSRRYITGMYFVFPGQVAVGYLC